MKLKLMKINYFIHGEKHFIPVSLEVLVVLQAPLGEHLGAWFVEMQLYVPAFQLFLFSY
jgi:hypothetical protein